MHTKSLNKNWIWLVIIIVVAAVGYFYVNGSGAGSSSTLSATSDANAAVGAQVLGLLNQIQSLRIDTTIFNDPGYKTLRDYSVVIPPVNVGRPNPFAPLPGIGTNSSTTPSLGSVTSVTSSKVKKTP